MTPKEKADELVNKFFNYCSYEWWEGQEGHKENMKQCALIAVDEMIAELAYIRTHNEEIDEKIDLEIDQRQDFLIQVEKEIKAL
jgi:hypothetical protein